MNSVVITCFISFHSIRFKVIAISLHLFLSLSHSCFVEESIYSFCFSFCYEFIHSLVENHQKNHVHNFTQLFLLLSPPFFALVYWFEYNFMRWFFVSLIATPLPYSHSISPQTVFVLFHEIRTNKNLETSCCVWWCKGYFVVLLQIEKNNRMNSTITTIS